MWQHVASIPKIPSPSQSQHKLGLHGKPENGTTQLHGSRSCGNNTSCCSDKGLVLAKGGGEGVPLPTLAKWCSSRGALPGNVKATTSHMPLFCERPLLSAFPQSGYQFSLFCGCHNSEPRDPRVQNRGFHGAWTWGKCDWVSGAWTTGLCQGLMVPEHGANTKGWK
jgi:hypothetical protein